MMEAAFYAETSVKFYQTTRRQVQMTAVFIVTSIINSNLIYLWWRPIKDTESCAIWIIKCGWRRLDEEFGNGGYLGGGGAERARRTLCGGGGRITFTYALLKVRRVKDGKTTVHIMYSNNTGWLKKMDSISYVHIFWTIQGMWIIYITFERESPKFSNTDARALA